MPPGGGVGITSINREISLDEMIAEVRKRKAEGMPSLGKSSCIELEVTKRQDAFHKSSRPDIFFSSQRHIDKARDLTATGDYNALVAPSISTGPASVGKVAKSVAGGSTYVDLLKKMYGQDRVKAKS
eukprot:TRINITY_DN2670_c0_g1_i1.p1 TRINITY_DN2670_c0_g1~~TRINITY_DN2670_c0_g1_i1.p1  ORF type:complete len:127 (+),score=28.49 TRINITY_DN2670_c0_g1_i1:89-469(+)